MTLYVNHYTPCYSIDTQGVAKKASEGKREIMIAFK